MDNEKRFLKSVLNKIDEIKNERIETLESLKNSILNNNLSELLDNAYKICGIQRNITPLERLTYKQLKQYDLVLQCEKTTFNIIVKNHPTLTLKTEEGNYG